uniref:Putative conserved secreted protein n=1 Tax=Culex tarsalis TaxID=7177 RepID=A0A1Q3FQZ9_CULTA
MQSWTILTTAAALATLAHGAIYPWYPIAPPPWWVRAPEKDIPASVNLQQVGGSYSFSTVEGKAYQAVAPSSAIQPPPVTAVHVQGIPSVAIRYLPTGQAVLVPSIAVVNPAGSAAPEQPSHANDQPESADGEGEPTAEPPREPAPVSEQPQEREEEAATEESQ